MIAYVIFKHFQLYFSRHQEIMAGTSSINKVLVFLVGWSMVCVNVVPLLVILLVKLVTRGKEVFQLNKRDHEPKIVNDPKWGSHKYAKLPNQNIKLHYVEKGDRTKPLLLCVHGFPECWFSYRETLVEFSKDYWVVAVDMRGYGDSDKPARADDYKLDILVDDLRELIEVLGKEKCYLVAHDWGGAIAWVLVHRYPSHFIKHISLNGPHRTASIDHRARSLTQAAKSWYINFFQLWYLPELVMRMNDFGVFKKMFQDSIINGYRLSDEELEVYKYYFSLEGSLTGTINYYRKAIEFSPSLENMRCDEVESLIIWGCLDTALDLQIPCRTFKYCNKLRAVFLPDAGHFVLQEYPKEVHRHIQKFLEE